MRCRWLGTGSLYRDRQRMSFADHFPPAGSVTTTTMVMVRFERPQRISFACCTSRAHFLERFELRPSDIGT